MNDQFTQVPFDSEIARYDASVFAENPEPRCACVLLLDTSGSMNGRPIQELNEGLQLLKDELMADSLASKRVELAILTFGPVAIVSDFVGADTFCPPQLKASGDTPMGSAIEQGLALLRSRKDAYQQNGIEYFRPWVFLITDGGPTDTWKPAAKQVLDGETSRQFQFFAVGVEGANFDVLRQISERRAPLRMKGIRFRELFAWLSNSLSAVSHSQVGEQVDLQNPTSPDGWATVG